MGLKFQDSPPMHLKEAFGNDCNFGFAILDFEGTMTWQYMHTGLSLYQSKRIIFMGTTFLTISSKIMWARCLRI